MRPNILLRLLPWVAALAGTFLFHRFSLLTGLDRVQADTGDSRFVAFLLEHWNNALAGAARWNSPPIFWPERNVLAYSDLLVGMGVVHAGLRSVLGVFAAMNAQLVLLSLTSFAAAYALLRRGARLRVWPATAGAYFFAFSWPRFAQLSHVQMQFTTVLPLMALLGLEALRDGRALGRVAFGWRAVGLAVLLVGTLATTIYYAVFAALALCVATLMCLCVPAGRAHLAAIVRRQWLPLAVAAGVGAVLVAPIVYVFLPVMRSSGGRAWAEVASFLPRPGDFFWMGPENAVWGWFFARWPEADVVRQYPEFRIGVGLVASLAWAAAIAWAAAKAWRPRRLDRVEASVVVLILTGAVLQALMLRLPGDVSAWGAVWQWFPGATGLRGIARLELVVTLAMALGIGVLLDRARPGWRPLLAGLALVAAIEQVGRTPNYSGALVEALSRRVGEQIPASCRAAYVIAPPDLLPPPPPPVDEAHFDAGAYLRANPDVAASWGDTAWLHYERFGRAEGRTLDAHYATLRNATLFFAYNYTIPLAAALRRIPVANGLSGWQPPGWNLFDVLSPDAPAHLQQWLQLKQVPATEVCLVPVRITLPEIPDPPPTLMP